MDAFYATLRKMNGNGNPQSQAEKERQKQEWMRRYASTSSQAGPPLYSSWTAAVSNPVPPVSGRDTVDPNLGFGPQVSGAHTSCIRPPAGSWGKPTFNSNPSFHIPPQHSVVPPPPPVPLPSSNFPKTWNNYPDQGVSPVKVPPPPPGNAHFPEKLSSLQAIVNGLSQSTKKDSDDEVIYMGTKQGDTHPSSTLKHFQQNQKANTNQTLTNRSVLSKNQKRRAKKERQRARKAVMVTGPIPLPKPVAAIEIDRKRKGSNEYKTEIAGFVKTHSQHDEIKNSEDSVRNYGWGVPCPSQPIHLSSYNKSPVPLKLNIQHQDMEISEDEIDVDTQRTDLKMPAHYGSYCNRHVAAMPLEETSKPKAILDNPLAISSSMQSFPPFDVGKSYSEYSTFVPRASVFPIHRNSPMKQRLGKPEMQETKIVVSENDFTSSNGGQDCMDQEIASQDKQNKSSIPHISSEPPKVDLTQQLATTKIQLLKAKARLLQAQKIQVEMMNSSAGSLPKGVENNHSDTQGPHATVVMNDKALKRKKTQDVSPLTDIAAVSMQSLIIENIGNSGPSSLVHINAPKRLKFMRDKTSDMESDKTSEVGTSNSVDGENMLLHEQSEVVNTPTSTPQLDVWKKRSVDLKLKLAKRRLQLKLLEKSKKQDSVDMNHEVNVDANGLSNQAEDSDRNSAVPETTEERPQILPAPSEEVTADNLRLRQRELRELIDTSKKNQKELSRKNVVTDLTVMIDKQRELLLEHGERIKETSTNLKECLNNVENEKSSVKTCEGRIGDLMTRKQILEKMVFEVTQKLVESRRRKGELECQK